MKKHFQIFFLIFLKFCSLTAETSVEVRADFFFHSSQFFRHIYGEVGTSLGIEAAAPVYNCFDGWVNFDWFETHGKSISKCKRKSTKVEIANISLGVRYPFIQFCNSSFYVGGGPSFSRIWLRNKSPCMEQRESKWALGLLGKLGFIYYFRRCVFFDAFVDYLYQPIHFKRTINIGGFKTGLGVGVSF